jgi:hypothetical protein
MSLPYGSFSTSDGCRLVRPAGFCTPTHRAVRIDPSWLMNEIQALLV